MSNGVDDSNEQGVRLRLVTPDDLPSFYQHQIDPVANRMAGVRPRSREDFDIYWQKLLNDSPVWVRAIVWQDLLAGCISLFKMEGLDSVGYWVARELWGREIATRALQLLLQEIRLRPLHARASRQNFASLRVLEKCGFEIVDYRFSPASSRYEACEEARLILR